MGQDQRSNPDRRRPGVPEIAAKAEKTNRIANLFAKLVLVGMCIQLLVIGYVFITEYNGRTDVVTAARQGCERDKLDRKANARGWRIAEEARRKEGQTKVADDYAKIAGPMEKRSRINCKARYPKASMFP